MCGLFGFISSKGDVNIDKKDFVTLGIFNDSRGGDSVGILADDKVEYGIDTEKFFTNFYKKSELLNDDKKLSYLLGHTRKASVGKVTLENAQPVVIYNPNNPNEIDFVLFHNGTLKNHLALAAKYLKMSVVGVTDTYIMAHLLYQEGFKMFKEYIGAGMFITVDFRNDRKSPTITFYKGASPTTESVAVLYEERPLYAYFSNTGIWYSSIKSSLELITFGDSKALIMDFPVNTAISYKNGKETMRTQISRTNCMQGTAFGSDNVIIQEYLESRKSTNNRSYQANHAAQQLPPRHQYDLYNNTDDTEIYGAYCSSLPGGTHGYTVNELQFEDGLYLMNGELAHGKLNLNLNGQGSFDNYQTGNTSAYYFYAGVLLYGKNIFDALTQIEHDFNISPEELYYYHPYMIYWKSPLVMPGEDFFYYTYTEEFVEIKKTGLMYSLLTRPAYSYLFENGCITKKYFLSTATKETSTRWFFQHCTEVNKISAEDLYNKLIENIS